MYSDNDSDVTVLSSDLPDDSTFGDNVTNELNISLYHDGKDDDNLGKGPNKGLRILNWNVNSALCRKEDLLLLLNTINIDIVTLQESRLTEKTHWNLDIPGYKKYYLPAAIGANKIRGLITLVKEDLSSVKTLHPNYGDLFEHLTVNIQTPEGIFEVQNIYWSERISLKNFATLSKANKQASSLCICGDFNAHHQQWIALRNVNNQHGNKLAKILNSSPLVLANPIEPTTINGSMLDMCIVSENISSITDVQITDTVSDVHYAMIIEINIKRFLDKESFIPRLKFESADWDLFMHKLDENFSGTTILEDISPDNLDAMAVKMAEIYYDTATQTIPQTKYHHRPWQSWYWCPEVARATRKANYWRRAHRKKIIIPNLRRNKERALKEEQEAISKAKHDAWTKICNDIVLTNNDRKAWKRIKSIRRIGQPPFKRLQINPQGKAEELARAFAQRTSSSNLTRRIQDTMALLEPERLATIQHALNTPDPEYDKEFTEYEIEQAFSKGKDSAPGEDRVTYKMAKNSGPVARSIARRIYNISWNTGRLATTWKTAAQAAIPKPQNRDEFRPISLLSVFDKNIERIAHERMMRKVKDKLHPNLYGFAKGRGTQDGLMTVSHMASSHIFRKNATNTRSKGSCVAVFVDLEKAFEMANKNVILSTLAKLGVKGKLLAWIKDYLTDRRGYVTIDGFKSEAHDFENGTPQGSIISPALFNIIVHELLSYKWPNNVEVFSYADDLVIIIQCKNYRKTTQQALDVLSRACEELGLKINARKTKIMYFFSEPDKHKHKYYVGFGEDAAEIEIVTEFKYLGVIYTQSLSMDKHINATVSKAYRKMNLLKALACKDIGCETKTLIKFVTTGIRPVLEFGIIPLNAARITKKSMQKLESVLPAALKIAMGLPRSTRNHAVLLETGVLPLSARTQQASMTALAKIIRAHTPHPLLNDIEEAIEKISTYHDIHGKYKIDKINDIRVKPIPDNHQPWLHNTVTQLMKQEVTLTLLDSVNPVVEYKPPIGEPHGHNTLFCIIPLTESKTSLTEQGRTVARNSYTKLIDELSQGVYLTIYTDASVDPVTNRATVACAVYKENSFDPNMSSALRISDHSGSMTAELHAIKCATLIIRKYRANFNKRKFLIVTDSMSGLQALRNTADPDNRACILGIHKTLDLLSSTLQIEGTIMWCPSHIDIPGNEQADEMAGAAMNADLPIIPSPASNSVIKAKIRSAVMSSWRNSAIVSDFYSIVNQQRLPFRVPAAPRSLQSALMRLRFNTLKYCAYRCQTLCQYCEDSFTTGHYLISCPVTSPKLLSLKEVLRDEEHNLADDPQAATILNRLDRSPHDKLFKVMEKFPPLAFCPSHEHTPAPHHIAYMPP